MNVIKRKRKPKGQLRMDNPKTMATFSKQDTRRRQTKQNKTQKNKQMRNTDSFKNLG